MNKKENLQKIADMRRRYSETLFRAAVQHLFDTGHENFDEQAVAEAKAEIEKTTPPNAIMTAGFSCKLLDCCFEMSKLPVWDVLLYVKLYLGIDGDDLLLYNEAERALHARRSEFEPQAWRDACKDPELRQEIIQELVERHEDVFSAAEIKAALRCVVDER